MAIGVKHAYSTIFYEDAVAFAGMVLFLFHTMAEIDKTFHTLQDKRISGTEVLKSEVFRLTRNESRSLQKSDLTTGEL